MPTKRSFLINLDRRPDRLKSASANLVRLDPAFERISGFDAGDGSAVLDKVDWKLAYIYDFFRPLRLGAVGCFFAHRAVWQKIVDENIPQALVLEDDVGFTAVYDPEILKIDLASLGLDCLRLEEMDAHEMVVPVATLPSQESIAIGPYKAVFRPSYGAAARLITLQGARKLLQIEKYWFDTDHFDMWEKLVGLRTAILEPAMFQQINSPSDIARPRRFGMEVVLAAARKDASKRRTFKAMAFFGAAKLHAFAIIPWPIRRLLVRRLLKMN